jgi:3-oxoacyl-[acyl-carrier protein] reductase
MGHGPLRPRGVAYHCRLPNDPSHRDLSPASQGADLAPLRREATPGSLNQVVGGVAKRMIGMQPMLEGHVALVTGASRGIGAAIARTLGRHGAFVGVNYRHNAIRAREVVEAIEAEGGGAVALQADVRDEQRVASIHRELCERAGPVDTLVLNAVSSSGFRPSPLHELDDSVTADMTTEHLRLCLVPVRALAPSMIENGGGSITVIGSEVARHPIAGMGSISVAKSAVAAVVRSLAQELGPRGVRVNLVSPGMVHTELSDFIPGPERAAMIEATPLGRIATPDDVAGAVLMVASGHAGFVTGVDLAVQGGARIG